MKLGYYPGCALKAHATSLEYGIATDAALKSLGVELNEIPDWNCCGASAAHMTNLDLTRALNVRNLAIAEAAGYTDLLAPCPLCAKELCLANHEVKKDPEALAKAQEAAEMVYHGTVRPITLLQFLYEQREMVQQKITRRLPGIKVCCYYGCLHTRPKEAMGFDDTEQPTTMDELSCILGLEPLEWSHKVECCGAGFTMSRSDIVARLTGRILRAAKLAGAEAIVVACPMCHANLAMRQGEAAADAGLGKDFQMPIIYLAQAIGLALGLTPEQVSLGTHYVDTSAFVQRLGGEPLPAAVAEAAQEK
jgi:heterodisulfide reductase subunit B